MIVLQIVWDVDPEMIRFGNSYALRYYSICFALGFLMGYLVVKHYFKKAKFEDILLEKLFTYIFIATILGARLGHCLFYEPGYYLKRPWEMILPFNFDGGQFQFTGFLGLASHGAILGIFLAILFFARKYKQSAFQILDMVSVGGAVTAIFIRLGNFMNSEILGRPTNGDYGVIFKLVDDIPRHPAQLYESFAYLIISLVLMLAYNKTKDKVAHGFIFGLFFCLLFLSRFIIEFFKEDQVDFESSMLFNMGQLLSIPFFLFGLYILLIKRKK